MCMPYDTAHILSRQIFLYSMQSSLETHHSGGFNTRNERPSIWIGHEGEYKTYLEANARGNLLPPLVVRLGRAAAGDNPGGVGHFVQASGWRVVYFCGWPVTRSPVRSKNREAAKPMARERDRKQISAVDTFPLLSILPLLLPSQHANFRFYLVCRFWHEAHRLT